jgi:signal peptidase I
VGIQVKENQTQAHLFENSAAAVVGQPRLTPARNAAQLAKAVQEKGWAFLKVSGKSMFPWIRERDVVFLRRARMDTIASGDLIVFEKNGLLCMHRVLVVNGNPGEPNANVALVTKGDATADADAPVSSQEFRGKVEFIYRRHREIRIATGWRKLFGRFLAFISPATRWWKPAATFLNRDAVRCEVLATPAIEAQRQSGQSAD